MKLVPQEHPMGCAVACVASICDVAYGQALRFFNHPDYAATRGYYCAEICAALAKGGRSYAWKRSAKSTTAVAKRSGTIVFVTPNKKYPAGHFLLRTRRGYMNPWSNYPSMKPVRAAFTKRLPGKVSYVVFAATN